MAVELCSENSGMAVSPARISFSYDLCQSDVAAVEQVQHHHAMKSNSSSSRSSNPSMEFDFCVRGSFEQESYSADELFSDGKMIPTEIKKKTSQPKQLDHQITPQNPSLPTEASADQRERERNTSTAKESKIMSNEADEKQSCSKSFWGFKRSSSCGSGYGRSLCPLPRLSRSNSTGSSSSSVKRSLISKEGQNQKQNSPKSASKKLYSSSSTQSSASMTYQKPPLKKGHGSYGNGVPINPALNVPAANLFGFGLIFSNGKDKTKKK